MKRYATISVLREVKEILEKHKGDQDWSSFLLKLLTEARELKARVSFEELRRTLSDEDLEGVLRSSKEFRERFKLG